MSPSCWLFSRMQEALCFHFLSLVPILSTHWRERESMYLKRPNNQQRSTTCCQTECRCITTAASGFVSCHTPCTPISLAFSLRGQISSKSLTHECCKSHKHLSLDRPWPLGSRNGCFLPGLSVDRVPHEEAKPPAAHAASPEGPICRSKLPSQGRIQMEPPAFLNPNT